MRIRNASNFPIFQNTGALPDVSGGLQNYYQPMIFESVSKAVNGFQVVETPAPIYFHGVIQPYTGRQLMLLPEGQRAWTWFTLHAETALVLNVDDVVKWLGKQTRIMGRKDYALYGYVEYSLVQDWTGSGP